MKKIIAAAVLAATAFASPAAEAYQLLPNLYAKTYCDLRKLGVSYSEALNAAMEVAIVSDGDSSYVTIDGKSQRLDVVQAAVAVTERCPGLMK